MGIRSMTGFGRVSVKRGEFTLEVLIKGVNSRFSEFNFKLPSALNIVEQDIRGLLQRDIHRGKVTLIVGGNMDLLVETRLQCDRRAVQGYLELCKSLGLPTTGEKGHAALWEALRVPGVLKIGGSEDISARGRREIIRLVGLAIRSFLESKEVEGRKMKKELKGYHRRIGALLKKMIGRSAALKDSTERRVRAMADRYCADPGALLDRISLEIASALDRLDVSEECARLRFHLTEFDSVLNQDDRSPGRKLDFLLQEMQREVNTIGSKGRDTDMSRWVVSTKDYLERMREQVQNIE